MAPLLARGRWVSGRKVKTRTRVVVPRMARAMNIEWNPRNRVRIPPKTGPMKRPDRRASKSVQLR